MPPPALSSPLTLVDLCEPLFQYICMLNRIARNPGGESLEFGPLQKIIKEIFESLTEAAEEHPALKAQFEKVRMPLIFFVDSILSESELTMAPQWNKNRLAYEVNELAGDEKFFDDLDQTLEEKSPEADERLTIFYTCLGLGFQGWYAGQAEYLRKKMLDLAKRIPPQYLDTEHAAQVCPEAYQFLDTRNLVEPPAVKLVTMAIIFVGFLFIVMAVNFHLFRTASSGLSDSLKTILAHDLAGPK